MVRHLQKRNATQRHMTRPSHSGPSSDETTHFGDRTIDKADKARLVDQVFERVASRYDLMNDLMSGGLHRLWKDAMVAWLSPPRRSAWSVIDVAGGTGDIAFRIARRGPASMVTVVDLNADMLAVGRDRAEEAGEDRVQFVQGDAMVLPAPDGTFDAYTIAFGIRNVTDIDTALSEAWRVLKPGGRFLCLEFSQVTTPILDQLYDAYSYNVIPRMGRAVAGDSESYRYLVESIRRFPNQDAFAAMIDRAGFRQVKVRDLSGGIAALHSAYKI